MTILSEKCFFCLNVSKGANKFKKMQKEEEEEEEKGEASQSPASGHSIKAEKSKVLTSGQLYAYRDTL